MIKTLSLNSVSLQCSHLSTPQHAVKLKTIRYVEWEWCKNYECTDKHEENNHIGAAGETGWRKGEEDSFIANSETSRNWTGWHYVWMRLVFLLMAGKSFRGMLGLFGRIPLAWGSPPPLMMNRVGSAAFLYDGLIALTAELRVLLDPVSCGKKRGLRSASEAH